MTLTRNEESSFLMNQRKMRWVKRISATTFQRKPEPSILTAIARPTLIVTFRDEDDSHARARVRYNTAPERAVEYQIFVTEGTVRQPGVEKNEKTLVT